MKGKWNWIESSWWRNGVSTSCEEGHKIDLWPKTMIYVAFTSI